MESYSTPSGGADDAPPDLTTLHVRRARDGDVESLRWVVERLTPVLLGQARFRLRGALESVSDPEDVVNDVWMRTLPRIADIGTPEERATPALVAYLSRTLLNRVNELIARHLRGRPNDLELEVPAASELPKETLGIVTRAVADEQHAAVLSAIDELPEADREVVVLRAIEQRPNAEVAELLELAPNTVAMRFRRAMDRLREKLPGSVFDELGEEAG